MKKHLQHQKGVFVLLLAFFLGSGTAYAYDFSAVCSTGQTLYYNIIDATQHYVELTCPGPYNSPWGGYTQPTGNITLPSSVTHNGVTYTVKEISSYAFFGCEGLTGSLTIPNTVTLISDRAFAHCVGLSGTLTIGTSVTTMYRYSFLNCVGRFSQLKYNAVNCNDVTYSPFEDFHGTLTIGSSVQRIPAYMFYDCSSITGTLTIPTSVTSIGEYAFRECSGFTQVKFNAINCADVNEVTCPFKNCGSTLTIGSSVQKIPAYMFFQCTNFTGSLTISNSVTSIGQGAFSFCTGFTGTLTLGSSLATIGTSAFWGCDGFSGSLTIPNSVSIIGTGAFYECTGFNGTLTIGTGVTGMGEDAFNGCSGFTQVRYNAFNCGDVTYNSKPFEGCGGTLTIGSSVMRIPAYMFYGCTGFTGSLTIPSSVTSIGWAAFYNCNGFNGTLSLGSSLNTIDTYAFYQCTGFTGSLTIPNSVTTLNVYAFCLCSGFTSLTIGNSVSLINYGAFYGCTGLNSMTVRPETPPTLGSSAFYNVSKTIPVYVPCSSLEDYQAASGWNEFTNMQCNYLVTVTAVPTTGGSVSGSGTYTSGSSCTVTANPNLNYLFMHWSKDGEVVSSTASYTFTVTEDVELEAVFMSTSYSGPIIGEGEATSVFLPSYSYYKYTLSEQIYTADELDGISNITSISFFNAGATKTRTYDIYMKHTSKSSFGNATDWISVTSTNKVYSGSVTMRAGQWNTIVLDTPFAYNGSSNLVLVVDDNSGSYTISPHMECRVYDAVGNQSLRIYNDGTNYDPSSPSSYSGILMNVKNQIMFNRTAYTITATSANTTMGTVSGGGTYGYGERCTLKATAKSGYIFLDWTDNSTGAVVSTDANYSFTVTANKSVTAHFLAVGDYCNLTFDLFDSYGDGWNGNYLVVNYSNGMSKKLAVPYGMSQVTYTLPIEYFDEVELTWIQGSWTYECSFAVSDPYGLKYVGSNMNGNFEHTIYGDCDGDSELTYLGNYSLANNLFLPSYSYYNYSLSEQIYTADEIGASGLINSIAFYNTGAQTKTRYYKIYLATTDKTEFESQTDWISASDATLVYTGDVTMHSKRWSPIVFNTPFDYDGSSNLVLIVDDNTGSYTGLPHMECLVYPSNGFQAIRIYSDNTNYDPFSPSDYTGTPVNMKNQLMFNIVSCVEPLDLYATNITTTSADINWSSSHYNFEFQYRKYNPDNDFENGFGDWTTIDADGDGHTWQMGTSAGYNGSTGYAESESYINYVGPLTPDNYLVSPKIALGGSISFWACGQDASYAAEHFGVAVSTTGNTNASDFTTIQEWTMTAKGEGIPTDVIRGGNRVQGTWYEYTVNLSAYSGQTGYVAIRHFDCTDQFRLNVDDIIIQQPGIYWTGYSNATSPYALTGLTPGTQYEVRVRSKCAEGIYSDWVHATFTTLPIIYTQTVVLSDGWNWWSTYIEQEGMDGLTMLEESLGTNGLLIKSSDAFVQYSSLSGGWTGTMSAIDNESGYKINVMGACTLAMSGPMAASVDHPITLSQGWNWIGYPVSTAQNITAALSGFVPRAGDVLKGQDGYTTYNGSLGWTPSTFVLSPGESYMYYSTATSNKTLVFAEAKGADIPAVTETCYWKTNRHAYPDNLSIMAVVEVDGEEQRDEALELGAFVNGECRGSAKLYHVATLDRYIAFLTVTGQDGEQVEFRLLDESEATRVSSDRITFSSNAIVGNLDSPFPVHFGAMNDLAEMQGNVNVYPNPVDRNTPFILSIPEEETVAEVLVVNAMGEVVTKETSNVARSTMEGLPTAGVYMVKVTCKSGKVYIGRVVVK